MRAVTPRRGLAILLAALLAACGSAPPPASSATAGPSSPVGSPGSSGQLDASLADRLRDAIDPATIQADLTRLQEIVTANGGNRAAGTPGHDASAEFVAQELRDLGYAVEPQPVGTPVFRQDAPTVITVAGSTAPAIEDTRDFKAMLYSPSGSVDARIHALGFDPAAQPGDRAGLGCEPDDWVGVPVGSIVLLSSGPCRRHEVVALAQDAGAVAVITAYPDWRRDAILRPTLGDSSGLTIPSIGATQQAGLALAQAAQDGAIVHVEVHTTVTFRTSNNVIGESPDGDPAHVVMLGGHLDSVLDGPGVNDNGSGTMTVLAIARALAQASKDGVRPAWKVRVGFWTAEEIGLVGSQAYVQALDAAAIPSIAAYLNFDMIGSPNAVRVIYDGSATTRPTASGAIQALFQEALDAAALTSQLEAIGAVSDHFPFDLVNVPVGGLFSGANELRSPEQVALFGGAEGVANDPCYHLACDGTDNVDPVILEQHARAAAWVVGRLASGEVPLE